MDNLIYFDNSSTTKPCDGAVKRINDCLNIDWGNPSSLHSLGLNAQLIMDNTRESVAKLIKAASDEIYFTSGGTEANNLCLIGAALARKKRGNKIVTTTIEHPSVLNTVNFLDGLGFDVVKIKPQQNGIVNIADINSAIDSKTVLVSIMLVNNETGAVQPVQAAAKAIKDNNSPALLHCDAVQGFGKMPINVNTLGVDLMSASGHKIHASKGVGFFYKKKGIHITAVLNGGEQENGLRSGTQAVPLIAGLGGAVEAIGSINTNLEKQQELWNYARQKITEAVPSVINSPDNALPYILNISVEGYRSETLLHFLDSKGIFVSSGSACAKGATSFVLKEMGLSNKRIDSALRLSFSRFNKKEEIDRFCIELKNACKNIRKA